MSLVFRFHTTPYETDVGVVQYAMLSVHESEFGRNDTYIPLLLLT